MDIGAYSLRDTEVSGTWQDLSGGGRVLVASKNSPAFQKALLHGFQRAMPRLKRRELSLEDQTTIRNRAMADHILLDWQGIEENGALVPYSRENAFRLLTDYPKFAQLIVEISETDALFEEQLRQEGIDTLKKG